MYRSLPLLALGLIWLMSSSSANQLNLEDLAIQVGALEQDVKELKDRLNNQNVECYNTSTPFDEGSDRPIMYLDRQNVNCPQPYVLAQFALRREGDYNSAKVRYVYKCCKFVV